MAMYSGVSFIEGSGNQQRIDLSEDYVDLANWFPFSSPIQPIPTISNQTSSAYQDNHTNIVNWDGENCMMFARNVCFSNCIDTSSVNLEAFRNLTGGELASCSQQDFCNLVGEHLASLFFRELRGKLLENEGIEPSNLEIMNEVTVSDAHELHDADYSLTDLTQWTPTLPKDEDDSILEANVGIPRDADLRNYLDDCDLNIDLVTSEFAIDENAGSADLFEDIPGHIVPESYASESYASESYVQEQFFPPSPEPYPSPVVSPSPVPSTPSPVAQRSRHSSRSRQPRLRRTSSPTLSDDSSVNSNGNVLRRVRTTSRNRERGPKNWEYLMRLLHDNDYNPKIIKWEDEEDKTFRIVKPSDVAHIWGKRSRKGELKYDNFARGLRYHYKTGALKAVSERQLVYRCGPVAIEYLRSLGYGMHHVPTYSHPF